MPKLALKEHKELRAKIMQYIATRDSPPSKCEICRAFGVSWSFVASLLNEPNCGKGPTLVNIQKGHSA
jgi:hypothetical protein